jgi:glycosyltransferase 2 family protein
MKNSRSILIRVGVSATLLGLLFWLMRDEIRDIGHTIADSNISFLAIALVFVAVNVWMLSWRLKVIFLGENLTITMNDAVQLTVVGYFFNNFMPTAVGGDIVKAHYASVRYEGRKAESYASVLMDRFIGLYSFLIVAAVALAFDGGRFQLPVIRPLVFTLLLGGVGGFVVMTNRKAAALMDRFFKKIKLMRLGERLHSVYRIVHDYRNRRTVVVKSLLISLSAQCLYFTMVYVCFSALGAKVSLGHVFLVMPVVTFISMIPSVGGLGVREGAIVAFFSPVAGREDAFAVSLLVLCTLFLISMAGGAVYLWWGFRGRDSEKTKSPTGREDGKDNSAQRS